MILNYENQSTNYSFNYNVNTNDLVAIERIYNLNFDILERDISDLLLIENAKWE